MGERLRLIRYELGKLHAYLAVYITPGAFWGLVVCQAALLFLMFTAINQSRETRKLQVSNTHLIASNHRLAVEGAQAHKGVCAFRSNLQRQVFDSTRDIRRARSFLPRGAHIAGLPTAVLRQAIKSREETLARQKSGLKSLSNIGCNTRKKRQ